MDRTVGIVGLGIMGGAMAFVLEHDACALRVKLDGLETSEQAGELIGKPVVLLLLKLLQGALYFGNVKFHLAFEAGQIAGRLQRDVDVGDMTG